MDITFNEIRLLKSGEVRCMRAMVQLLQKRFRITAQISVTIAGERRMQTLNHQYRGKNTPTDVLSFGWKVGKGFVGDVMLCPEHMRRIQKQWPGTFTQQLAHRFVHGVLHVIGYDHESQRDVHRMERAEREILGFDPYRAAL